LKKAVFRIRGHFGTDPDADADAAPDSDTDSALFVSDLQDTIKKLFLFL
jgi:hypothetical protein